MRYLVADVETYGTDPKNGKLLGVALCGLDNPVPVYYSLQQYDYKTSTWIKSPEYHSIKSHLKYILTQYALIGHNYVYDKLWIDDIFDVDSKWHACTRLMWHMASAPSGPRPYGLKDAQVEVLGWANRGNEELNDQIKARKGTPGADIYLADNEVIARYAKKDAESTAGLYNHLKGFFDKHDYWWMLDKMMQYSLLLQHCTDS